MPVAMTQFLLDVLRAAGGVTVATLFFLAAAWAAIKYWGAKWLDSRFETKLKQLDAVHDEKLRHLQGSIDRELDRALRLQSREFDALGQAWALLHEAFWRTIDATGRTQRVHSFAAMSAAQAEAFIEGSDLNEWQKTDLRAQATREEKDNYYVHAHSWNRLGQCKDAVTAITMFVDRNSIFMQTDIREIFEQLRTMMNSALTEFEIRIDVGYNRPSYERAEALRDQGQVLYQDLEKRIHGRVWSASATKPMAPT